MQPAEVLSMPPTFRNQILHGLANADLAYLSTRLEPTTIEPKQVLSRAGEHPEFVYFPEGGILSYTLLLPHSGLVEFGIIGREGLSSFSAIHAGRIAPVTAMVQIGGAAHRLRSADLREAIDRSAMLQNRIHEFLYQYMGQMSLTAVSNARHPLVTRLARLLLLCDDRLDTGEVPVTHEFMAMMLGAQRTSVTSTLHVLEGEGAIRSRRGIVYILCRDRLLRAAGEAYIAQT